MARRACDPAGYRRARAPAWCCVAACAIALAGAVAASAATLAEKARESGCVGKPVPLSSALYKCVTASGAESFFNVPDGTTGTYTAPRRAETGKTVTPASPAGFPRVDADTQKGRDDLRRKVLADELSVEEKALTEARGAYENGAPAPLAEERADAEKYRQRIARLRQAVLLHERNVEALKKELATTR